MNFYLDFKDSSIGTVYPKNLLAFRFDCSLFKTFSMARLQSVLMTKDIYNILKCGMPVDIVFFDDKEKYVNEMRVLSFDKAPNENRDSQNFIEIFLISSIYFDNSKGTMVHEGSVGNIIQDIMKTTFRTTVRDFSGSSTDDMPRRRYQTEERTLDFIQRILKYGYRNNMPVYFYYDAKGTLNLRGVYDLISMSPKCEAHSLYSEQIGTHELIDKAENSIRMYGFHTKYNGKSAVSKVENRFTVKNFRYMDGVIDSYTFTGAGSLSNQVQTGVPPKVKFYGWNLAPTDALSIAAKDTFEETCEACQFEARFQDFPINKIKLGDTITITLPYDKTVKNSLGEKSSLGDGKYLITGLSFCYENGTYVTESHMVQVAC